MSAIIEKEMGYTRMEFLNQFKLFAKDRNYRLVDNSITLQLSNSSGSEAKLLISLHELSDRSIGALNIPRLLVKFTFNNYTQLQQKQFFKKFDLSFQRGGG